MTKWIERYRREAEERYRRLDAVLAGDARRRQPIPTDDRTGGPTMTTTTTHETKIEVDERYRSSASPESSTRHPSRCSGRTSTPSSSCNGTDRATSPRRSSTSTAVPAARTAT